MDRVVLDASAILALILGEPGAEIVGHRLADADVSALNFSEIIARTARLCGSLEEGKRRVDRLDLSVIPFDAEQAILAASLVPSTRAFGISLADRACISLGLSRGLTVVTADKAWKMLTCGVTVECIR